MSTKIWCATADTTPILSETVSFTITTSMESGACCFDKYSLVEMHDGTSKSLYEINIGDRIKTFDTQNLPQERGHPLRMMNPDKWLKGYSLYGS